MNLIEQVKVMRKMENSKYVLNRIGFIQNIKKSESFKEFIGLDNDYDSFERLEVIAYKIAIKKANTVEEIEECAKSIEENYIGMLCPLEWAEEVRIKAYGIEWYLKKQFRKPSYKTFVDFTDEMGIKNPYEELERELMKVDDRA